MCGIVGGFWAPSDSDGPVSLTPALGRMRHRGPDDAGQFHSLTRGGGRIGLGQTRLSIIDLSLKGHQPMSTQDDAFTLVFNGEIYNYRELRAELEESGAEFRSDSDTEVLLEAWRVWGEECLPRLRGMFAFAVYSAESSTLTVARDAFGIKPLFYSATADAFTFASEVTALSEILPGRPQVNVQRVYEYLVFGRYDVDSDTFWRNVHHLPPGHVAVIDLPPSGVLSVHQRRWWWPSIEERDISFADAADEFRNLFLDSVRLQLRSDVPLGAALSGGVDSSAIVAAMRFLEPSLRIQTFSYVARGAPMNEERWIDLVANSVGVDAHKTVVSASDLARDIDDVIRTQGEPFGSTSIYAQYRVYRLARENGVTVTLDGQGADELLAGYFGYPSYRVHSLLDRRAYSSAIRFVDAWAEWPGRERSMAVQPIIAGRLPEPLRKFAYRVGGRNPAPRWLNVPACDALDVDLAPPTPHSAGGTKSRRLAHRLRQDLTGGNLAHLLRHGDRNSMRFSVESRVPFLSPEIAEFTLRLPESYLVSDGGETKHVFKEAMRGIVPAPILGRRDKVGFETPEQDWLRVLAPQVDEWLEGLESVPIVDVERCRATVRDTIQGQAPFSWQAWRLINLARWSQLFL